MKTYAGACYSGPYFGQNLSWTAPYYHVALYSPGPLVRQKPPSEPINLDIRYGTYTWDDEYGAWCWRV